ncbi:MAG: DNA mismatch repair endonuclease MutL [Clostridia bacterium]|nr:DNA mismatch repair endonuclease MutL [Clostridia bacterium]
MGIINILDTQTSNMIAAGEVVDRPASAVKELIENAVDAGATKIHIEIRGGGIAYIRVTDNGAGISKDDLPKTVLRHATSKIRTGDDIDGVMTLGFRGEALAAIASVSNLRIISKQTGCQGHCLESGEDGVKLTETGCADGTSVIIEELFYNTPARRKFLKKDSTEAAAIAAAVEKEALANPDIRFKLTVDGVDKITSAGDGKLFSAIYTVCGREFASALTEIDSTVNGIRVYGYITKPESPRGSRSAQTFYINGRYIKSKTVMAALEEGYRSFIPPGKFPGGVILVCMNPKAVDVNVHPAKTEVRFANERDVFEAVYWAVRNALTKKKNAFGDEEKDTKAEIRQSNEFLKAVSLKTTTESTSVRPKYQDYTFRPDSTVNKDTAVYNAAKDTPASEPVAASHISPVVTGHTMPETETAPVPDEAEKETAKSETPFVQESFAEEKISYRIAGELFDTYLIAESEDKIMIIDKHAAHERILYEQLKDKKSVVIQELLTGVTVELGRDETETVLENASYLADYGFITERFGDTSVIVRSVPVSIYKAENIEDVIREFARTLSLGDRIPYEERVDKALFTVACKAAIKAGWKTSEIDAELLFDTLLENGKIRYCPHGRPIIKIIDKKTIDKFFDR